MADISQIMVGNEIYDLKDKEAVRIDSIGEGFELDATGKINALYRRVELINSFTVAEDAEKLVVDKDTNGNPFELEVALMQIQCGMDVAAGKVSGSIVFSTPTSEYFVRPYLLNWEYPGAKITDTYTRPSSARVMCDVSRGFTFVREQYGDEGGAMSTQLYFPADVLKYTPDAVIVKAWVDFKIPKNAKVWLYGVRRIKV